MSNTTVARATAIRPFEVHVPPEVLDDLRRRIAATRWPEKETVADQSQGVQLATIQEVVRYWGNDWVTNTEISSGRLYWENTLDFFNAKGVTAPAAISVFPRELYEAPRSWAEQAYPNLVYFNKVDRGNHFAAWQEPELFTEEVRAAFRPVRAGDAR